MRARVNSLNVEKSQRATALIASIVRHILMALPHTQTHCKRFDVKNISQNYLVTRCPQNVLMHFVVFLFFSVRLINKIEHRWTQFNLPFSCKRFVCKNNAFITSYATDFRFVSFCVRTKVKSIKMF